MATTGFFDLSNITFIKDEMDKHGSKIDKTEWDSYFNRYFEGSKPYQEHHIASYQHTVFQPNQVSKQVETQKRASEVYSSPPQPFLSTVARKLPCAQAPYPKSSSFVLNLLHFHSFYPSVAPSCSSEVPSATSPLLNLLKSAPLKLSLLKISLDTKFMLPGIRMNFEQQRVP